MSSLPELLKVPEAAAALRVDESWVYRHWPELGGSKAGGVKIPVSGILAYLEARKGRARKGPVRVASPRTSSATTRRILEIVKGAR